MSAKPMLVLGIMSGTSADGIDVAFARISGAPPHLTSTLLGHASISHPKKLRSEILGIAEGASVPAARISRLNFRLGSAFADAALAACKKFRVTSREISLIGSHGQTIFHLGRPEPFLGKPTASTLQIGDPSVIAAHTGITTVGDFRPADLALGGQGAPLVPFADYALYRHPKLGRISLNIGGIANITVIPASAKPSGVIAFDTGPGNMLIDALVSHFSRGRQRFDKDARLARRGRAIPAILDHLLRDPYLRLKPPKSTGREYFGRAYLDRILALGRRHRASQNDLIRTITLFTPLSIADALHRFIAPRTKIAQLLVSGGGAHNPLILAQLSALLPGIELIPSSTLAIPEAAKEAFAFALLAYETFHRRPSNLPSATGARGPAILGKICYAPPR
ncbi:MAG TPA: anhydro-N-acetylmuramic acid kinase [Terriglobales bacterium]|nr:anhydro-N-acetylmuramic acid kinase [Terriglobales bacterium]